MADTLTEAVITALDECGYREDVEDAIDAWCARTWSSSIPSWRAGLLAESALQDPETAAEFAADVAVILGSGPVDLAGVDWTYVGVTVLDDLLERRMP